MRTRRALLGACCGVGIVGVAGCVGGDDEPAERTDETNGDGPDDTAGNGGDTDDEAMQLDSSDGWAEPHDGVEIPAEPGEAILTIGGETVTLAGAAYGGELADGDRSVTGADTFELQGAFQGGSYRGDEISVNVTRMVGYEDTSGRWAESDSIGLTGGDNTRLGNVIYRRYEDGRLADAELAGELEGRRFTDGPFVHVTREGVLTAVEEVDSHVDESLNGRFEFGARLPENWTEL